jgi:sulfatase maturation enzyme AslB (radical SAM superfamily)
MSKCCGNCYWLEYCSMGRYHKCIWSGDTVDIYDEACDDWEEE